MLIILTQDQINLEAETYCDAGNIVLLMQMQVTGDEEYDGSENSSGYQYVAISVCTIILGPLKWLQLLSLIIWLKIKTPIIQI